MPVSRSWIAVLTASALAGAFLVGCSSEEPTAEPEVGAVSSDRPERVLAEDEATAATVELTADEIEAVQELPEDEAELALAQKVCPISGAPLGSMDVPAKVVLDGQPVFLCCAGCIDAAEKDPEATLAKVNQAPTEPGDEAADGEANADDEGS